MRLCRVKRPEVRNSEAKDIRRYCKGRRLNVKQCVRHESDAMPWKTNEIFLCATETDTVFRDKGNGLRDGMVGMILEFSKESS